MQVSLPDFEKWLQHLTESCFYVQCTLAAAFIIIIMRDVYISSRTESALCQFLMRELPLARCPALVG
jgi:hypothetical protein